MSFNDLTGNRYGRLLVIKRAPNRKSGKIKVVCWECICECGNIKIVAAKHISKGSTRSCGCLSAECLPPRMITHGMTNTRTYTSHEGMMARCYKRNDVGYFRYGGRGIKVCDRWHDFESFIADMGERPDNTSLDRIDNNKNYEPGNCRWATSEQQMNNTRANVRITFSGKSLTVAQWARELGINERTLRSRVRKGLPPEKILSQKVRRRS